VYKKGSFDLVAQASRLCLHRRDGGGTS